MKSRVKSSSRSPAPLRTPTMAMTTTTTPSQFFPPSYFAAAAGVPYPPNRVDEFSANAAASYRRRSQLGDLECQLLPTLGDTVERMTRPPSQVVSTRARTPSSSSSQSSSEQHPIVLAPPSSTPSSALRSPGGRSPNLKSILKSHSHAVSDRQRQTHPENPTDHASLARKPGRSPLPIPPDEHRDARSPRPKLADGPLRTGRARSRTDPGTLPKGFASMHVKNDVPPPPPPRVQPSGIPRRVGIPPSPATPRVSTPAQPASSSNPDMAVPPDTRRLFVTNAEMASSSSSESQAPLARYVKPRTTPTRTESQSSMESQTQLRPPRFGLGLSGVYEPKHATRSSPAPRWAPQMTMTMADDDDHVHVPSRQRPHPRGEGTPKRHARVDHADGQRRQRELLSLTYADDSEPSSSEGSEDLCLASDGSGESLRSAFDDDSGSEYSPLEEDERDVRRGKGTTPRQSRDVAVFRDCIDHAHVEAQYTPRPSSITSHRRQSKRQTRRFPVVDREDSPTVASDEDTTSSINETVVQGSPQRYSSELSRIMAVSGAVAAQQRQAFGIRTSLERDDHDVQYPHTDSEMSLIGADTWLGECEELATGSLLQQQRDLMRDEYDNRRPSTGERSVSSPQTKSSASQESIYSTSNSPLRGSSESIGVPESPPTIPSVREERWQTFERHVLDVYGEVEARRQRIVWEVTESEETFVVQLQNMTQLFISPLRVRGTRMWVSGIPGDVTKLFDWLDDIVCVHAQLSSLLAARQIVGHPRLQLISEIFRAFVPKLETYQPYLVKLEFTASMIDALIHEGKNDFGDFIRLQEAHERCQGWSLEQYLIEPVNRLAQYPDVFRRLLQLTPKSHPDYMSTLSLFHAAKLTIRVLSEVKDREDAYELVKMACAGIRDVSPAHLAHRERRLLIRGPLTCVHVSNDVDDDQALSLAPPPDSEVGSRARRADKLTKAIHVWRGRSNSVKSMASTVVSFGTAPSSFDVHTGQRPPVVRIESEPVNVEVMVFTDLVLLASRVGGGGGGDDDDDGTCDLAPLDGFGLARVVSVLDEIDGRGYITLDLAPLTSRTLEEGHVQSTGPVVTIALSRPNRAGGERERRGAIATATTAAATSLNDWLAPLRRSCHYTHRALASLSLTYPLVDRRAADATAVQQPVLSLLAAGLPLPKSPSMQMAESACGMGGGSEQQQEREERGWWSKRFHEVFAELSVQDDNIRAGLLA